MNQVGKGDNRTVEMQAIPEVPIDIKVLIEYTGASSEFIEEVLRMILAQAHEAMARMLACIEEERRDELFKCAHKYKSSISMLGNELLSDTIAKLEFAAGNEAVAFEELKAMTLAFTKMNAGLVAALNATLSTLRNPS